MSDNLEQWPADKVERRPLAELVHYARNARIHSPAQVAQLKASMVEFGFTTPILVDENDVLIAGHGRLMAAQELGYETVPTMVARGWTKAQVQAYRIADNKLALNAEFDTDLLRIDLGELKDFGFDIALTGFGQLEFDALVGGLEVDGDPKTEWQGTPEYQHEDQTGAQTIKVHFATDADVQTFAKLIGQPLTEQTRWIWFPPAEIVHEAGVRRYESEEEPS